MSRDAASTFDWSWNSKTVRAGYDDLGTGPTVVLLPSFSTVSTRDEMRPLAGLLAPDFRTVVPDWPGFGRGRHPRLDHGPALHLAFLRAFMDQIVAGPAMVVAAGHAAGYTLLLAREQPSTWSRIVLVAPTWRGPLPTMMGGYKPVQGRVRAALDLPGIGHALYRLNVATPVLAAMYRRHVYADPARVTRGFIAEKAKVARRHGGRFGSAAFVTGALDPAHGQAAFLDLAAPPSAPTLLVYGPGTPPKSRAGMEALALLPGIASRRLATGSLGVHEECAGAVAEVIRPFLLGGDQAGPASSGS
jgi:pimeloyl-ACP methyl ester carboxylesterase